MVETLDASVMVGTYRLGGLNLTLDSLSKQRLAGDFELVLADELYEGRKQPLKEALERYPDLVVRHVPAPAHPHISVAETFNAGLMACRGETVLICGDYTHFPENMVQRHVSACDASTCQSLVSAFVDHRLPVPMVEHPKLPEHAISTFTAPLDVEMWLKDMSNIARFEDRSLYLHEWPSFGEFIDSETDQTVHPALMRDEWVLGLISLPRHVIVDRLNGFDEVFNYGRGYSDYDLVMRAEMLGWRFLFDPDLVLHRVWQSKGQLIDKASTRDWKTNQAIVKEKKELLAHALLTVDSHKGIRDLRHRAGRWCIIIGGGANSWAARSVRALQSNGIRAHLSRPYHQFHGATDLMVYGVSPGDIQMMHGRQTQKVWYWWTGTDVWNLLRGVYGIDKADIPRGGLVKHLCVHERLRVELEACGIESQVLMDVPDDPPLAEEECADARYWDRSDALNVLVYLPMDRPEFYGYQDILLAARSLPDVHFSIMGTSGKLGVTQLGKLPNVTDIGTVKPAEAQNLMLKHHVHYRPTEHDGLPYTFVEMKRLGKHVISNWGYPHCDVAKDGSEAVLALKNPKLRSIDREGMRWYRENYNVKSFAENFARIVLGG